MSYNYYDIDAILTSPSQHLIRETHKHQDVSYRYHDIHTTSDKVCAV